MLSFVAIRITIAAMRRFLASAWFPVLICFVFAAITTAAYAGLQPSGDDIGNSEIQRIARIAAWGIGPLAGILSMFLAAILNLIRRIVHLRKVPFLHPLVVLLSVGPWLVFSWILTDEPRYTPIARAVIDFTARELLWGSLVACLLTILLSIPLFFPTKQ